MKILVVDDDIKRGESITAHLVETGCAQADEIERVTNSDDAKQLLRAQYFDALLLDVVLPKRENERPSGTNSHDLLEQLHRRPGFKKPGKIIGITSHSSDLGQFRESFGAFCTCVLEAAPRSNAWKPAIEEALQYAIGSQLTRAIADRSMSVLTVHGIRTFGHWQSRFKRLASAHTSDINFQTYRYGYFSVFSFLIPVLRNREVHRFQRHLSNLVEREPERDFVIFSHSFGTYIVARALREIEREGRTLPIRMLVLAGSVLRARFDWSFIKSFGDIRIINDCGTKDFVLWLSDAIAPLLGKAGKTGFHGFNNDSFSNRFFIGGHDLYFKGDNFMKRYWIPLLDLQRPITEVDERVSNVLLDELVEKFIGFCSMVKELVYIGAVIVLAYHFWR